AGRAAPGRGGGGRAGSLTRRASGARESGVSGPRTGTICPLPGPVGLRDDSVGASGAPGRGRQADGARSEEGLGHQGRPRDRAREEGRGSGQEGGAREEGGPREGGAREEGRGSGQEGGAGEEGGPREGGAREGGGAREEGGPGVGRRAGEEGGPQEEDGHLLA